MTVHHLGELAAGQHLSGELGGVAAGCEGGQAGSWHAKASAFRLTGPGMGGISQLGRRSVIELKQAVEHVLARLHDEVCQDLLSGGPDRCRPWGRRLEEAAEA